MRKHAHRCARPGAALDRIRGGVSAVGVGGFERRRFRVQREWLGDPPAAVENRPGRAGKKGGDSVRVDAGHLPGTGGRSWMAVLTRLAKDRSSAPSTGTDESTPRLTPQSVALVVKKRTAKEGIEGDYAGHSCAPASLPRRPPASPNAPSWPRPATAVATCYASTSARGRSSLKMPRQK